MHGNVVWRLWPQWPGGRNHPKAPPLWVGLGQSITQPGQGGEPPRSAARVTLDDMLGERPGAGGHVPRGSLSRRVRSRRVWGQGAGWWERKEGQGHQAFSWGREETLGRVWCRAAPWALSVPLSRAPHTADCACEAGVGYGEEERSRWPPVGKLFILQSHRR